MKKLTTSEKIWLIIFLVIVIGLMAGCMMATVMDSGSWKPRPTMLP